MAEILTRLAPAFAPEVMQDNLVSYVFSDSSVGRDNHRIFTSGWKLDQYKRNPVFLFAHKADEPPIGKTIEIGTRGDQLGGVVRFANYPFAELVRSLVQNGFMPGCSVGWMPLEFTYSNDPKRRGGMDVMTAALFEISAFPIPSLNTALAEPRGVDTEKLNWLANKAEALDQSVERQRLIRMTRSLISARPPPTTVAQRRALARQIRESFVEKELIATASVSGRREIARQTRIRLRNRMGTAG